MKESAYVANVISRYRKALDNNITKKDKEGLKKTFNRTFTKGYLFHEDPKDITNIATKTAAAINKAFVAFSIYIPPFFLLYLCKIDK